MDMDLWDKLEKVCEVMRSVILSCFLIELLLLFPVAYALTEYTTALQVFISALTVVFVAWMALRVCLYVHRRFGGVGRGGKR